MRRTHIEFACVCRLFPQQPGQSAAPEERALTQILSTEPLQRENFSSFLCLLLPPPPPPPSSVPPFFLFYSPHPLRSILPSGSLYYFIFLRSLYSPPLSLPLFFSLYLSLALTSLQHCSVGEDASTHFLSFFLPSFLPARCITQTQRLHPLTAEHAYKHTCVLLNTWAWHVKKTVCSMSHFNITYVLYDTIYCPYASQNYVRRKCWVLKVHYAWCT